MNVRATFLVAITLLWLATALSTTTAALAQPAGVSGATFEHDTRPLRTLIDGDTVNGDDWLAYRVPKVAGTGAQCCYDRDRTAGCRLARDSGGYYGFHRSQRHELQPGQHLLVFLPPGTEHGRHRVRAYDSACPIDADGLRVRWLGDVSVRDSLAVLGPWAQRPDKDRSALHAIALHAGNEATDLLASMAWDGANGDDLRSSAAFWLASHRGADGYRVVRDLINAVDRPSLRHELVGALAQSVLPEALDQLIDIARHDRSAGVRGQGLFWLAQTASSRVARVLMEAAERDPETGVKQKAVFAISQLPTERGVPLLINVAEQHASAAVRERAIFWLGQSEDSRALELIVSLLN